MGTALVSAMATDAWGTVRSAVADFFGRNPSPAPGDVQEALDRTRDDIVAARREGDVEREERLVGEWRLQFAGLLAARPELVEPVRLLLEERITPALSSGEKEQVGHISIDVKVSGRGRANVLGSGTQHNR
ncbi:hypothetical protein [Streptomyces erythrochromogenes]|uniref:hypothetical protein n=1 Tax=Streptomyces erythrochromogenes TaxID=285574 RepID=UPI003694E39E